VPRRSLSLSLSLPLVDPSLSLSLPLVDPSLSLSLSLSLSPSWSLLSLSLSPSWTLLSLYVSLSLVDPCPRAPLTREDGRRHWFEESVGRKTSITWLNGKTHMAGGTADALRAHELGRKRLVDAYLVTDMSEQLAGMQKIADTPHQLLYHQGAGRDALKAVIPGLSTPSGQACRRRMRAAPPRPLPLSIPSLIFLSCLFAWQ
jgi:hypothetical protein